MDEYLDKLEKELVPARRSKLKLALKILAALIVVAVAAMAWWLHTRDRVSTDDAQVDATISPTAARIAGSVMEVPVKEGQSVKKGDVLVRIDPRDYQARVDQAKAAVQLAESRARGAHVAVPLTQATTASGASNAAAQLAAAQAEYERSKMNAAQASTSEVAFAQANVEAKRANFERAQADLARMKPLADKAEISRLQYDSYVAASRVAESELQAAQERLASARQQASSSQASVLSAQARVNEARAALAQSEAQRRQVAISSAQAGSAEAEVAQAKANLKAAELQLSYTTVFAPFDGIVTRKSTEMGQFVQAGQGLMMIVALQDAWVVANFKETQLAGMRVGQAAEMKVDMGSRKFRGRVTAIAGATGARMSLLPPENATGNFVKVVQRIPVKIVPDALPQGLVIRPGMNVDVTVFTR